jgi:hypothetical protein
MVPWGWEGPQYENLLLYMFILDKKSNKKCSEPAGHPYIKGIKVCSNKEPGPLQRGDPSIIHVLFILCCDHPCYWGRQQVAGSPHIRSPFSPVYIEKNLHWC